MLRWRIQSAFYVICILEKLYLMIKTIVNPQIYNNTFSKGLFWLIKNNIGDNILFCVVEPIKGTVNVVQPENKKMNHERTWSILDKRITRGKPYNYFPRGRVEIKQDKAIVYLNPILNDENIVNQLIDVFGLKEENGISRISIKNDNSWHYRYLEDKS